MEHGFFGTGLLLKVYRRIGGTLKNEVKAKRQVKRVIETCERLRGRKCWLFRVHLVHMFKNWKLLFENIYENTCGWKNV